MKSLHRKTANFFLPVVILLVGFFIGEAVIYKHFTKLFFMACPLLFLLVWKSNLWTLLSISIIVFFGDWLIYLGIAPPELMWFHEFLILVIFVKAVTVKVWRKRKILVSGGWIIGMFLGVSLLSTFMNSSGLINFFLFQRLLIRYYLLFLAVINLDLQEKEMMIFNTVLLGLVVIQIPVALIKFLSYGQGELAIGTYAFHGGVPSIVLPLIVISFAIAYFILYKKSLFILLLAIAFIFFAIVGGKRGFIFYLPIILLSLAWFLKRKTKTIFRYAIVATVILVSALYFTLILVPTLSPGRYERTGLHPLYAITWAIDNETREIDGISHGRVSSTINVSQNLIESSIWDFLFGKGPGYVMKSTFSGYDTRERYLQEFSVRYGVSGLVWLTINVGYLGAFLYFLLIVLMMILFIKYYNMTREYYWRAFGLGMIGFCTVMIIINLTYANIFKSDLFAMHFFCLSAFVVLRKRLAQKDISMRNSSKR